MYCIRVELGERSYWVEVESGLLASGRAAEVVAGIAQGGRICIVTHPSLFSAYAEPLLEGLKARSLAVSTITIPPGERFKSLKTVARLYSRFLEARLDRKSLVVAVGGGVLGDLTGFAA